MAISRATKLARPEAPFENDAPAGPPSPAGPRPKLADKAASPVASQARALQDQLAEVFDPAASGASLPVSDKWPPAATLGFILATCGTFWVGAAYLASRLIG